MDWVAYYTRLATVRILKTNGTNTGITVAITIICITRSSSIDSYSNVNGTSSGGSSGGYSVVHIVYI